MELTSVDRRGDGRLVDVRLSLDRDPDHAAMRAIGRTLRRADAVLQHEGREVAIVLSGTTADNAARVILPRLRATLQRLEIGCSFAVNGKPVTHWPSVP